MTPTVQDTPRDRAADALTRLAADLDDLLTLPTGTLDRDDVEHLTRSLYALGNRLDATKLHLLRRTLEHAPESSVVDLLATSPVNLSRTLARKDVTAARHTDPHVHWDGRIGGLDGDRGSLALMGGELAAGNTTLNHVHGAVTALQSIPTPLRRGTIAVKVRRESGEEVWTTQHRGEVLDGFFTTSIAPQPLGTAAALVEDILTVFDPERGDRHVRDLEPDPASRRTLTFTRRHGMLRMTVDLDEAAAVVVRSAVEAAAKPQPTAVGDDTRSVGQRRHDGLVALVTTGAHHPASDVDPVVAHKATVVLRATLNADGSVESGTATADTHGPVTDATLRAASCDADVTVAVMDRLSRPRSLHTLDRHATDNQRLIVAERDRGCIAPGCGAPAWACHLHHVVHWADGGPTSVDNLVLLCGRDHRALHAGRLEARFGDDGLPEARRMQRDLGKLMTPGPWTRNDHPALRQQVEELSRALERDDRAA
ncbi:HNH endonuclease [Kineococcus sp. NPDC059986]|uniref:HNH endonuclease n=1 Tax=Kineococcus sp. NPDC059986 TaxID=3155538 RepID=UPI00344E3442